MKVQVDVTGFRFSIDVDATPTMSVMDVMTRASKLSQETKSKMNFQSFEKNGSHMLYNIEVEHMKPMKSRQVVYDNENSKNLPSYAAGVYRVEDEKLNGRPNLVWQYYIYRKGMALNGRKEDGTRDVIPFSETQKGIGDFQRMEFEDGDRIVWRLIAIPTTPLGPNGHLKYIPNAA
ncbi:MAG: hypothetical protein AAF360_17895 [Pseudomonadota bacterium]